jgi:hypothetical protein
MTSSGIEEITSLAVDWDHLETEKAMSGTDRKAVVEMKISTEEKQMFMPMPKGID